MPRKHRPKSGSLAYLPRGRAARHVGRVRNWPEHDGEPTILGFAGYKAGMTHVILVDERPESPYYGHELIRAVTVLDSPPLTVCGIKGYKRTQYGLKTLGEVWAPELSSDLKRTLPVPKEYDSDGALEKLSENLNGFAEIRAIMHTQPRLAAVPTKRPAVFENMIGGGTIQDRFEYIKNLLGKEVKIRDILKEGNYVDVIAITKGKGFQGPVKRWGIKILPRKSRKTKRGVGAIGPWHPARVMYSVPRAGQMGYHQRVEVNKRILKIGEDGKEISPAGGFLQYGIIKGPYVIIEGTLPGPVKRLIRLRYPIRTPTEVAEKPPEISIVSTSSKQGK
ncbi:MAG: 50S ribosomal protein L3 [Promethearchaeota archaeon]